QPGQVRRSRRLQPHDRRTGAAAVGPQRGEHRLPQGQGRQAGPPSRVRHRRRRAGRAGHRRPRELRPPTGGSSPMPTYEGRLDARGLRIALLASRFNETITKSLLEGALSALRRHGLDDGSITVAWVPGAFELPLAAKRLAASGEFDAVVCLGAVIRGATAHFDYVAGQSAAGVARAALDTGVPVIFGVLTTETIEQAI